MIPQELVLEILSRLPIKSLHRCKCVCHSWRNLIENPSFAHMHLTRSSRTYYIVSIQPFSVILPYMSDNTWFLDPDDITTPNSIEEEMVATPTKIRHHPQFSEWSIICSCNGLLCLVDCSDVCICNPVTGEYVLLPPSPLEETSFHLNYGIGFDAASCEYKVVRIFKYWVNHRGPLHAEVCRVGRSSSWRYSGEVPYEIGSCWIRKYDFIVTRAQFIDGAIHWYTAQRGDSIISMDMESEEFQRRLLPQAGLEYKMIEWKGRLGLLEKGTTQSFTDVWVLEDSKGKMMSWRKDLSILCNLPFGLRYETIGIQKNGDIFLKKGGRLASFNLQSKNLRYIDFGSSCSLELKVVGPRASLVSISSSN